MNFPIVDVVGRGANELRILMRRISRHGVLGTARLIPENIRYIWRQFEPAAVNARRAERAVDAELGIDTAGTVPGGVVEAEAGKSTDIERYAPVRPEDFEAIMGCLPDDLSSFSFIDIGSGKGRALVLAARRPFAEVIGVELSPRLHRAAVRNVDRVRDSLCTAVRCLNLDAREFVFPPSATVVYFFNPFGEAPLRQVIENIERAHRASDAPVFLLYLWPFQEQVLRERRELWREFATGRHWKAYTLSRGRQDG